MDSRRCWRFILLLVCGCMIWSATGCSVYHYYWPEPVGETRVSQGRLTFRSCSMQHPDKDYANQTSDTAFSAGDSYFRQYQNFTRDSSKEYWLVEVCQSGRDGAPSTTLSIDSVVAHFEKPCGSVKITSLDRSTYQIAMSKCFYIAPLGVPLSYKGDFVLEFVLSIYDEKTNDLVERLPVKLLCKRHKKILTPWPGR